MKFSVKQGQASTRPAVVGIPVSVGFSICKTDGGSFVVTDVTSHLAAIRCLAVGDVVVSFGNHIFKPDDSLDHAVQLFEESTIGQKELVVNRAAGSGVVTRFTIRLQRGLGQGSQYKMAAAQAPSNHHPEKSSTFSAPPYPQKSEQQPAAAARVRDDASPLSSNTQTSPSLPSFQQDDAAAARNLQMSQEGTSHNPPPFLNLTGPMLHSNGSSELFDDEFTDDETVDLQLRDSGYAPVQRRALPNGREVLETSSGLVFNGNPSLDVVQFDPPGRGDAVSLDKSQGDKFQGQTLQTQTFAGWLDDAASACDVPDGWEGIAPYSTSQNMICTANLTIATHLLALSFSSVLHDDDGSRYYGNPSLKIVQREHPSLVHNSNALSFGSSVDHLQSATLSAASVPIGIDVVDITPDPKELTGVKDSSILVHAKNHKMAFDFGSAFREKKLTEEVISSDRKAKGFSLKKLLFG